MDLDSEKPNEGAKELHDAKVSRLREIEKELNGPGQTSGLWEGLYKQREDLREEISALLVIVGKPNEDVDEAPVYVAM